MVRIRHTLVGLDATTGELLWVTHERTPHDFQVSSLDYPQLSRQAVFVGQSVPGSVLGPMIRWM
ncbi:hypothetical protein EB74_09675 [Mycobacterium sp. SWH-M5]|nr:hypothetical protein EB74_09675 [Mycobacterium sp. SWH-M5]